MFSPSTPFMRSPCGSTAELPLGEAVDALDLLLLAQLRAVVLDLAAARLDGGRGVRAARVSPLGV